MRPEHDHVHESHPRPGANEIHAFSRRMAVGLLVAGTALLPTLAGGVAGTPAASAAEATVDLQTATPFSVLAGAGVTNTGPTVLGGDLGTCPTPAITGFPPGVVNGTQHANDAVACQAQSDLTIAYDSAAGRAPTTSYTGPTDLGGQTLTTGVYTTPVSFAITDQLTLDAQRDLDAVFIFQAGSTLITAPNSSVRLINGAQACNVFWQVGSSATLGVGSTFAGTVMSLASITANNEATVDGRLLARNGAVTLDTNTVSAAACAIGEPPTTAPPTTSPPTTSPPTTEPPTTSPPTTSPPTTSPPTTSPPTTEPPTTEPPTTSSSTATEPPTTSSSTATSMPTSSTTLPLLPGSSSSTTTTQPPSTTSTAQSASTASTGYDAAGIDASTTSGPAADVPGRADRTGQNGTAPAGTLPRTGSPIGIVLVVAGIALLLGPAAIGFGRQTRSRRRHR